MTSYKFCGIHRFPGKIFVSFMAFAIGLPWLDGSATAQNSATSNLSYDNWAQAFFTQNCIGCHNSNLTGLHRWGAPPDVNFDTLAEIRRLRNRIRRAATGPNAYMPPSGGVWWWDRQNLAEWLDADLPGATDTITPAQITRTEDTLYYQEAVCYLSEPLDGDFNSRVLAIYPENEEKSDQLIKDYSYLSIKADKSVVIAQRAWSDPRAQTNRLVQYTPPLPLLFDGEPVMGRQWEAALEVREMAWEGDPAGEPVSDSTRIENWRVTEEGMDTIDNGVFYPMKARKIKQVNLTTGIETSWWFVLIGGLVRRETVYPSDHYDKEIVREMVVFHKEFPLVPALARYYVSPEWLPLVGPDHNRNGIPQNDYAYECEVQRVGIIASATEVTPTPTPTLEQDPTNTPSIPASTPTLFPSGLPSPQPSPTAVPTQLEQPTASPTPEYAYEDPHIADLNRDHNVDMKDLLIFSRHWKRDAP